MNVMQRTMWATMDGMAKEYGGIAERVDRPDGFMVYVRNQAGKDSCWADVPFLAIENEGYRAMLDSYRELLQRELGYLPGELKSIRTETQKEFGKQKTPFRPGRRRVRHFRLLPSVKVERIVDLVWAETKSVPLTWSGT